MRRNMKLFSIMVLLGVLTVAFGLVGTVAPPLADSEQVSPEQSSSSGLLTHFVNPPTYDSGWVDIRDKVGESVTLTHNLNTTEAVVDVVGRQSPTGKEHALFYGASVYIEGWNKTYGGTSTDFGESVVQTSDGGYALAGSTNSYGAGSSDFWLIKTDSVGTMQWNKTYGGTGSDYASSVVQTSDGGYAMIGRTGSYGAGLRDFWLVKADGAGNMQWNKTYGGTSADDGESVVQTGDGGYALAGSTNSYGAGSLDSWLIKTDSAGNMQWNKTYGGASGDVAVSVVQSVDGGYALAGYTRSYGAGGADFWLVKADSFGNTQWNRTYGGTGDDQARSMVQTLDGGYALAGFTGGLDVDFWLVKTDSLGNMQWSKAYGGANWEFAWSVIQTSDAGYAIAGVSSPDLMGPAPYDFWLVKTDSAGNMQWNKTYVGTGSSLITEVDVADAGDGGYVLAGETGLFGAGGTDFWLIKTDVEFGLSIGLSMIEFTNSTITLNRGKTDPYWSYMRVRIWIVKEPTWQYGDINMDGIVDAKDLYILGRNYGKTFSLLSLTGIVAVAGIHTVKKRKQNK